MLTWSTEASFTNGKRYVWHRAKLRPSVYPAIYEDPDSTKVTLVINGYRFECENVEAAKIEAEERIRLNKEIYLTYF